ncbi:MAG: helix-turn-helix transcriptional regulator [Bacteroidota bacterium]
MATTILIGSYLGFISVKSSLQWETYIDYYFMYSDIPRWISLSVYLWLSYRLIINFEIPKKELLTIGWTKRFISGMSIFAALWLFHLIPYVIPSLSEELLTHVGWYPVYMPLVVLIYWIGINGLIISLKAHPKTHKKLDDRTAKQVQTALEGAMLKDKLYLNPQLKLNDVVEHIEVPQKTVSAVLNQHLNMSFNEFINYYRIEEVKSRLLSQDSEKLTITGIAYECGFNSQATFQRVFKNVTSITPKEFQQKLATTGEI